LEDSIAAIIGDFLIRKEIYTSWKLRNDIDACWGT